MSAAALRISRPSTPATEPALPRGTAAIGDVFAMPRRSVDGRFRVLTKYPVPPEFRTRPNIYRDSAQVPTKLADAFRQCRTGAAPWPLYVWGSVGVGKSKFGLVANDWYAGRLADFSSLTDEFKAVRCGTMLDPFKVGEVFMSESVWLERIESYRLLIVDEIGTRDASEHARETVTRILNARECSPLVLISNMGPVEIAKIFDERVSSRFCAGTVVRVDGEDRRLG
ncbi:hypothetical protein B7486_13005 [cyanobacterium TDX16]|nr:hypothetical protein B7486_13005 [cyanobacterium TDX16]